MKPKPKPIWAKIKSLAAAYKQMAEEDAKPIRLIKCADGALHGFEVNSRCAGIFTLCRYVSEIPGVVLTKTPRKPWVYFAWSSDHVEGIAEFSYKGRCFVIDGENDDCWIGAKEMSETYPELTDVLEHVQAKLNVRSN